MVDLKQYKNVLRTAAMSLIEDRRIKWTTRHDHDDVNSMVDFPVGAVIGEVCDEYEVTDEWAWQAYMHDDDDDDDEDGKKEVKLPPSLAWAAKQGLGSGSTSII